MVAYVKIVRDLAKNFEIFKLKRIPRGDNTSNDALVALASTSDLGLIRINPVEAIKQLSIAINVNSIMTIEVGDLGDEILKYITNGDAPNDQ